MSNIRILDSITEMQPRRAPSWSWEEAKRAQAAVRALAEELGTPLFFTRAPLGVEVEPVSACFLRDDGTPAEFIVYKQRG